MSIAAASSTAGAIGSCRSRAFSCRPAKVAELGLTPAPSTLVVRAPKALTTDQRNHIADLANDADDRRGPRRCISDSYSFYYPPTGVDPMLLQVAARRGRARAHVVRRRGEPRAVGQRDARRARRADRRRRRARTLSRANGYKAALLTAMGSALAIPLGLLPVAVFYAASDDGIQLVPPYAVIALLVVAVPVAAGLVTALTSAVALRVRPVRISTMAFD